MTQLGMPSTKFQQRLIYIYIYIYKPEEMARSVEEQRGVEEGQGFFLKFWDEPLYMLKHRSEI